MNENRYPASGGARIALPILEHVREAREGRCDSATLDLQKFPDMNRKSDKQVKSRELKRICAQIEAGKKKISADVSLPEIPGASRFRARSRGRLLVNHAGGILEGCNFALHRFFDCPVIPGSALKGVARSAAAAGLCNDDKDRFARVFGGEDKGKSDRAGSVSFLMALPVGSEWQIVMDILTNHFGCDTKNPNPVPFLAVEAGAVFEFTVAPTARIKDGDLDFAVKYLKIALAENGVGAKTSAGYGWFEIEESKANA